MKDLKGKKSKHFMVRNGSGLRELTSTTETRGLTDSKQEIIFDSCRCGKLLHNPNEVAAICVGGESLCSECSTTRCEKCNRIMCSEHSKEWGKRKVCTRHGLLEWLFE